MPPKDKLKKARKNRRLKKSKTPNLTPDNESVLGGSVLEHPPRPKHEVMKDG